MTHHVAKLDGDVVFLLLQLVHDTIGLLLHRATIVDGVVEYDGELSSVGAAVARKLLATVVVVRVLVCAMSAIRNCAGCIDCCIRGLVCLFSASRSAAAIRAALIWFAVYLCVSGYFGVVGHS